MYAPVANVVFWASGLAPVLRSTWGSQGTAHACLRLLHCPSVVHDARTTPPLYKSGQECDEVKLQVAATPSDRRVRGSGRLGLCSWPAMRQRQ
eukprot:320552-Chlamydomonas_euryale.AAC.11